MALFYVEPLPDDALSAAAMFHGLALPKIIAELATTREPLTLVFDPADHTHRGWRRAAVATLARKRAPRRVNAVESLDEAAVEAASRYLDEADGVTGQLFMLDGAGAGEVIGLVP